MAKNNYFQFKQFTIHQDKCAMKVTTDACIFGAVVTAEIRTKKDSIQHALDIGTGTGLLSLMLAQEYAFLIDAVEITEASYLQAKENVELSLFSNKIKLIHADIKGFITSKKYDLIISNPPFYEADLKSPDKNKNAAMHDSALKLDDLIKIASELLAPDGCFTLLLPYHRTDYFIEKAEKAALHLSKKIMVKQTPAHPYFRSILFFERKITTPVTKKINIKTNEGNYSNKFEGLLGNYYL